ncbi:hypothetical protein ACLLH4_004685 [Salmonella enterica]|nr:hypothetical protein [Salmonella enterica subsp. enterica]ECG5959166.1 hypothetical protein [Salmonella enterica subsp. enterica serovar Baguida]EJX0634595.1 hypothetical protein [Salmonella enterica]ECI5354886.1 hypothetical protein [Salmonella enterica subsp. enterica]EDU8878193.1 hypothetical protein [Salmonella enterica subsp. enterica]
MITGVDYVFYSNKKPFDIEADFITSLKMKWREFLIDEIERTDSRLELFFAKNKEMYSLFDEIGYSLNDHDEGCFMLVSSMLNHLESKIKILDIIYPESRRKTEPYDSIIMLRDIWEYTLVLPTEITESDFSRDIYTYLENVLR